MKNLILSLIFSTVFLAALPASSMAQTQEEQPVDQTPPPSVASQPAPPEEANKANFDNYIMLRGGIYSPSSKFNLDTINGGQTDRIDPKTGFDGELAYGHYLSPFFALELGAGYFEDKGSPETVSGKTRLEVVPLTLSAKVLLPLWIIEPYIEGGVGAYFNRFRGTGELDDFKLTTKVTYGLDAGAGVNINVTKRVFIGVEGRYIWEKQKFNADYIKLNGFLVTGDLGLRF